MHRDDRVEDVQTDWQPDSLSKTKSASVQAQTSGSYNSPKAPTMGSVQRKFHQLAQGALDAVDVVRNAVTASGSVPTVRRDT